MDGVESLEGVFAHPFLHAFGSAMKLSSVMEPGSTASCSCGKISQPLRHVGDGADVVVDGIDAGVELTQHVHQPSVPY